MQDWEGLGLIDNELRELQEYLNKNPEEGSIISGTGGLRKMRWKVKSKGKRSGARILYVFFSRQEKIYLIMAFEKGEQENISDSDKAVFKDIIKELES